MPKPPIFSQLFARSPISPLQEHMKVAVSTTELLPSFMEALFECNIEKATEIQKTIASLESEADEIKRDIRLNLPRSIFMPVPRSDLLELLQAQDRIPNRCQDFAGICVGREMQFPVEMQNELRQFGASTVKTVRAAGKALNELDELLESGFSGSEVDIVDAMVRDLNLAEDESDEFQRIVQHTLFKLEKDMNPVDVMFMYRLIEWLGDIADHAQTVGNRMLYLIAK